MITSASWSDELVSHEWTVASGDAQPVREPATGDQLGRLAHGTPADVAAAVERALQAQQTWAATSYEERAAALRRAGDLFAAHAGDVESMILREAGSVAPKAQLETHIAQPF
jgi:benzaldehyde dehydrogenase (NAD)